MKRWLAEQVPQHRVLVIEVQPAGLVVDDADGAGVTQVMWEWGLNGLAESTGLLVSDSLNLAISPSRSAPITP